MTVLDALIFIGGIIVFFVCFYLLLKEITKEDH